MYPKTEKMGRLKKRDGTIGENLQIHNTVAWWCWPFIHPTYKFIEQNASKTESEDNEEEKRNPSMRIEMFDIRMMKANLDNVVIKQLVIDESWGENSLNS